MGCSGNRAKLLALRIDYCGSLAASASALSLQCCFALYVDIRSRHVAGVGSSDLGPVRQAASWMSRLAPSAERSAPGNIVADENHRT